MKARSSTTITEVTEQANALPQGTEEDVTLHLHSLEMPLHSRFFPVPPSGPWIKVPSDTPSMHAERRDAFPGWRKESSHVQLGSSARMEPCASQHLFLPYLYCELLLRCFPLIGLQWIVPFSTALLLRGMQGGRGGCTWLQRRGAARAPAEELPVGAGPSKAAQGTTHTCFTAAPRAVLHQLNEEAGQVVGVQHPCQRAQGQTRDLTERGDGALKQIPKRIQALPEATGRDGRKTMTVRAAPFPTECHRVGWSAAVFALGTVPLLLQPAAGGVREQSWAGAHSLPCLGTYLPTWSVMNRSTDSAFREISNSIISACFCSSCGGEKHSWEFRPCFPRATKRQLVGCTSATTGWGGNQTPAKQTPVLIWTAAALPVCQSRDSSACSLL